MAGPTVTVTGSVSVIEVDTSTVTLTATPAAVTVVTAGAQGPEGAQGATGATGPAGNNSLTIGTTAITSGTSGRLLYDAAGVVGETAAITYATSAVHLTLTAQAATDVPLKLQGPASGTADLMRWGTVAGGTGVINYRGAVITPAGPSTLDGQPIDLGCSGYLGVGTMRVTGTDGSNNHFVQTAAGNLGFALNGSSANDFFVWQTKDALRLGILTWNGSASFSESQLQLWARPSGGSNPGRQLGTLAGTWLTVDATRTARVSLLAYDSNGSREGLRVEADGTNPLIGFLGATATARETVTGSRGGNAALADLLTKLATKGIITDGSSA